MTNDWLSRYPKAAAMLQGDDDVLDYAPQSACGLDEPQPDAGFLARLTVRPPVVYAEAEAEAFDRGDW